MFACLLKEDFLLDFGFLSSLFNFFCSFLSGVTVLGNWSFASKSIWFWLVVEDTADFTNLYSSAVFLIFLLQGLQTQTRSDNVSLRYNLKPIDSHASAKL